MKKNRMKVNEGQTVKIVCVEIPAATWQDYRVEAAKRQMGALELYRQVLVDGVKEMKKGGE